MHRCAGRELHNNSIVRKNRMNRKSIKGLSLFFLILLGFGAFDFALATDSRTRTTTRRNQMNFTENANKRDPTDAFDDGTVTIPIQGGSLSFDLCHEGINQAPTPVPCRVTPFLIPSGADTQLGTGLDPILGTPATLDAGLSFGGPTNDAVPSGSSNVQIPGFSVHGGSVSVGAGPNFLITVTGELTNKCFDQATCGAGVNNLDTTHFQTLESRPVASAGGICAAPAPTTVRCNEMRFAFDEDLDGAEQAQGGMKMNFIINSETDVNGDLVGTATGSYTINCPFTGDEFGCPDTGTGGTSAITGTFTVTEPVGGFNATSTGFVTMNQNAPNTVCVGGVLVGPFHRNNNDCQAR